MAGMGVLFDHMGHYLTVLKLNNRSSHFQFNNFLKPPSLEAWTLDW